MNNVPYSQNYTWSLSSAELQRQKPQDGEGGVWIRLECASKRGEKKTAMGELRLKVEYLRQTIKAIGGYTWASFYICYSPSSLHQDWHHVASLTAGEYRHKVGGRCFAELEARNEGSLVPWLQIDAKFWRDDLTQLLKLGFHFKTTL